MSKITLSFQKMDGDYWKFLEDTATQQSFIFH